MIFVPAGLAYLSKHNGLQLGLFCCKCRVLFFCMTEQHSIEQKYHGFFIHSSIDGHLGCFHDFIVMDCAAISTDLQIAFLQVDFISIGYIPRDRIAGSYGRSIFIPTSIVAKLVYTPTKNGLGYFSPHIFSSSCLLISICKPFPLVLGEPECVFSLRFPNSSGT